MSLTFSTQCPKCKHWFSVKPDQERAKEQAKIDSIKRKLKKLYLA